MDSRPKKAWGQNLIIEMVRFFCLQWDENGIFLSPVKNLVFGMLERGYKNCFFRCNKKKKCYALFETHDWVLHT